MTLTSRKTEREVRLRLDRLDEVLLRKIIREELEAHEARKNPPEAPKYWGGLGNALGLGCQPAPFTHSLGLSGPCSSCGLMKGLCAHSNCPRGGGNY
jgi:hypothetical protein